MDSPHALVRQAVCQMFAGLARLQPAMVCTRTTAADVSVPLAWHTDMLPAAALSHALATDPQVLGQPLIQRAFLQHGHACFFLTPQAYGAMMKHILANTLAPDPVSYTHLQSFRRFASFMQSFFLIPASV